MPNLGSPPFRGPGYQPCDPQVICNRVNHARLSGGAAGAGGQAARGAGGLAEPVGAAAGAGGRRAGLKGTRSASWRRRAAAARRARRARGGARPVQHRAPPGAQHKILQGELGGRRPCCSRLCGGARSWPRPVAPPWARAPRRCTWRAWRARGERAAALAAAGGGGGEARAAVAVRRALHQFGADPGRALDWLRDAWPGSRGRLRHTKRPAAACPASTAHSQGRWRRIAGLWASLLRQLATLGAPVAPGPWWWQPAGARGGGRAAVRRGDRGGCAAAPVAARCPRCLPHVRRRCTQASCGLGRRSSGCHARARFIGRRRRWCSTGERAPRWDSWSPLVPHAVSISLIHQFPIFTLGTSVCVLSRSVGSDFATPLDCTVTRLLCPCGFPGRKYWDGGWYPSPGDLPSKMGMIFTGPNLMGSWRTVKCAK